MLVLIQCYQSKWDVYDYVPMCIHKVVKLDYWLHNLISPFPVVSLFLLFGMNISSAEFVTGIDDATMSRPYLFAPAVA